MGGKLLDKFSGSRAPPVTEEISLSLQKLHTVHRRLNSSVWPFERAVIRNTTNKFRIPETKYAQKQPRSDNAQQKNGPRRAQNRQTVNVLSKPRCVHWYSWTLTTVTHVRCYCLYGAILGSYRENLVALGGESCTSPAGKWESRTTLLANAPHNKQTHAYNCLLQHKYKQD